MAELRQDSITPDKFLLDPNNFRFQDSDGFVFAAENRFYEEPVQKRTYERLRREENLIDLKSSIMRNGFVPVERLVVRPYPHSTDERYVIIEGNRRYAAVRWVLEDHEAGVNVDEVVLKSLEQLPVIIAEEGAPDQIFRASLMGIRHVSGIKQWGGYQRAKLVVSMRDDLNLEAPEIAERLGLSTQEVNRRYRAFKALQQIQEDEEYGAYAKPSMYAMFHEAVSLPIVRDWLAWDDAESKFEDIDNRNEFYDLITPFFDEDGNESPPKITSYSQVRELRSILSKPEAKRILLDPHQSFQDAINIAKQEEFSRLWATDVSSAIRSLEVFGIQELKRLTPEDIELLKKLKDLTEERLSDYEVLKNK